MKSFLKYLGVFGIGLIIGALGALFWFESAQKKINEVNALIHRANAAEEAQEQYLNGDPNVAIYLQKRILQNYQSLEKQPDGYGNTIQDKKLDVALLNARIGKLYKRMGDEAEANKYFYAAIQAFSQMEWRINDAEELLESLKLFDDHKGAEAIKKFGTMKK